MEIKLTESVFLHLCNALLLPFGDVEEYIDGQRKHNL